jgi:hypothetical protein
VIPAQSRGFVSYHNLYHCATSPHLLSAVVQELSNLPSCVWTLIEHIGGTDKPACSNPDYAPLFYHLGYIHSDRVLLPYGAQDIIVQLLVALKLARRLEFIEISVEWDRVLHVHAPSLRLVLLSARGGNQQTTGFQPTDTGPSNGLARQGTGYKVTVQTLKALAPLLQCLLHLSFKVKDYIACHQAFAMLCEALGVTVGEIWLDGSGDVQPVTVADAQRLVGIIRELMSGPCRGTTEGVLAGEANVANQQRLSSSNVYHRVYRDVPQFAGRDDVDGMCIGGEMGDKCMTHEQ